MARDKRNIGVGRGNGSGSKSTQFSSENWRGNCEGRPPKSSKAVALDPMAQAAKKLIHKKITVTQDGKTRRVTTAEAMVGLLFERFKKATLSEQLATAKYFAQLALQPEAEVQPEPPSDEARAAALNELLQALCEEEE